MIKLAKKLLVMLIVSVFMISMVVATAHAVSIPSDEKIVEHKEKKIKNYKIKWSANGGKIGTKKTVTTTVKKGSKVKLAKTPKRAGYSFQGWFSKNSGGKKITKNTKPSKSVTYFAHWKRTRTLNAEEKKLVGEHRYSSDITYYEYNIYSYGLPNLRGSGMMTSYSFNADGTYKSVSIVYRNTGYTIGREVGKWAVTAPNTITLTNRVLNFTSTDSQYYSHGNEVRKNCKVYYVKGTRTDGEKGYYIDDIVYSSTALQNLKEDADNGRYYNFYKKIK